MEEADKKIIWRKTRRGMVRKLKRKRFSGRNEGRKEGK
jgi:hypothetical protein